MRHPGTRLFFFLSIVAPLYARHEIALCGTTAETSKEQLFLHRQSLRARARSRPLAATAPSANRDIGNIAIIEDTDGVVARQNQFSLDLKTLAFTPGNAGATQYTYAISDQGYDAGAASQGSPLAALDDDDN